MSHSPLVHICCFLLRISYVQRTAGRRNRWTPSWFETKNDAQKSPSIACFPEEQRIPILKRDETCGRKINNWATNGEKKCFSLFNLPSFIRFLSSFVRWKLMSSSSCWSGVIFDMTVFKSIFRLFLFVPEI